MDDWTKMVGKINIDNINVVTGKSKKLLNIENRLNKLRILDDKEPDVILPDDIKFDIKFEIFNDGRI